MAENRIMTLDKKIDFLTEMSDLTKIWSLMLLKVAMAENIKAGEREKKKLLRFLNKMNGR